MTRSNWKGNFISNSLIHKKLKGQKAINIWSRNSAIPEFLQGKFVFVHNGQIFKKIFISRSRIGFKFGEFSLTKKFTKKQQKEKGKKKSKS